MNIEERAVSEGFDLIREFYTVQIKDNEKHSFRVVRNRGQNWFQVVRMYRKNSWPKGEWKARRATPLIGPRSFFHLTRIIGMYSQIIMDLLMEANDEGDTFDPEEFNDAPDFTPPGGWPKKER